MLGQTGDEERDAVERLLVQKWDERDGRMKSATKQNGSDLPERFSKLKNTKSRLERGREVSGVLYIAKETGTAVARQRKCSGPREP